MSKIAENISENVEGDSTHESASTHVATAVSDTSTPSFQGDDFQNSTPDEIKEKLQKEFYRREEVAQTLTSEIALAVPISVQPEDLKKIRAPGQDKYFVKYAHRAQNPPCDRPAFMICGAFPSDYDEDGNYEGDSVMDSHFRRYAASYNSNGATWRADVGHWIICTKALTTQSENIDYQIAKIKKILDLHNSKLFDDRKEFSTNVQERVQGKTGVSLYKKKNEAKNIVKTNPRQKALRKINSQKHKDGNHQLAQSLPNDAYIMGQQYAVVSFLCDITAEALSGADDPEPIMRVYGTFSTVEEAEEFRKTVSDEVVNYNIDIVMTGQWLFPEDVDVEAIKEVYRNENQSDIMGVRKSKKNELATFDSWCKKEGKAVPETIVEGDNVVTSSNTTKAYDITVDDKDSVIDRSGELWSLQEQRDLKRLKENDQSSLPILENAGLIIDALVEAEVTEAKHEDSEVKAEVTKAELEVTKAELEVTKAELEVTKAELEVTKTELENSEVKAEVSEVKTEVSEVKAEVSEVKFEDSEVTILKETSGSVPTLGPSPQSDPTHQGGEILGITDANDSVNSSGDSVDSFELHWQSLLRFQQGNGPEKTMLDAPREIDSTKKITRLDRLLRRN